MNKKIGFILGISILVIVLGGLMAGILVKVKQQQQKVADMTVNEETILVPGMTMEYQFLILTDQHTAVRTHSYIDVQLGSTKERMFHNANGTNTNDLFVDWMDYANEKQVDGVLLCGDIMDYYTPTNVQFIKDCLGQLSMPYLYTLGNHEMYDPYGYGLDENCKFFELFIEKNVNFQMLEYEELVICAIRNEGYEVNYDVLEGLELAKQKNKPILILAHVPFYNENVTELSEKSIQTWGRDLLVGKGKLGDTWVTEEFLNQILAKDSKVIGVITGDNHFYYKGQLSKEVTEWVLAPGYEGIGTIFTIKGE